MHASNVRMISLATALLFGGSAWAGEDAKKKMAEPAPAEHEHEHAFVKPSAHHKLLESFVGKWKTETKTFKPDGSAPEISVGTQTCWAILGGLAVAYEFKQKAGFQGFGITTWNAGKAKYQASWHDNMMPNGPGESWGTYDEAAKTLTEEMTALNHEGKSETMKMVTHFESPTKHVLDFFAIDGGKEMPIMQIVYTKTGK